MDKTPTDASAEPKQGNVASLVRRISSELKSKCATGVDSTSRRSFADFRSRRLKVIAGHVPTNDDELRLEINDTVEYIGDEEDGRMRGRLNGRVGTFPSSCVKVIDPLVASRLGESGADGSGGPTLAPEGRGNGIEKGVVVIASSGESGSAATSVIQPKKVIGVGFGNIFAANDGKIGLKSARLAAPVAENKRASDDLAKSPVISKKQDSLSTEMSTSNENKKEFVRAKWQYTAENDDELSLKVGDIITVLSRECEDPGWWLGELNGRRGVFPDNFVSPYCVEEPAPKSQPPVVPLKPAKPCPSVPIESASSKVTKANPTLSGQQGVKLDATDRKSDNVDEVDTVPCSVPMTAEKLDRLGAFRLPIFPKAKPVSKPVDAAVADAEVFKADQEKVKVEVYEHASQEGSEKLSHLTAGRPKMNKRPPSQSFLKGMAEGSQNGYLKTLSIASSVAVEASGDGGHAPLGTVEEAPGGPVSEEFDALRHAFVEFKSKVLAEMDELEKRFASMEALLCNKRPPLSSTSS